MLPCDSQFRIVDDNRHLGFGSVLNVSGSARPRVWAQGSQTTMKELNW